MSAHAQPGHTTITIRQFITAHPFLKNLNPHYFRLLDECASFERFAGNQEIEHVARKADFTVEHLPGSGGYRTELIIAS